MDRTDLEQTLAARERLIYEQEQRIGKLEDKLAKLQNAAGNLYQIAEDAERVFAHIEEYDLGKFETKQQFSLLLSELRRRKAKYNAVLR